MARSIPTEWINSQQAADILSANSGHTVSSDYVTLLSILKRLDAWQVDARTKLYHREDVERLRIRQKKRPILAG